MNISFSIKESLLPLFITNSTWIWLCSGGNYEVLRKHISAIIHTLCYWASIGRGQQHRIHYLDLHKSSLERCCNIAQRPTNAIFLCSFFIFWCLCLILRYHRFSVKPIFSEFLAITHTQMSLTTELRVNEWTLSHYRVKPIVYLYDIGANEWALNWNE